MEACEQALAARSGVNQHKSHDGKSWWTFRYKLQQIPAKILSDDSCPLAFKNRSIDNTNDNGNNEK